MGFTTIDVNKIREDVRKEREEPKPPFPFTGFHNCIFNLKDVRGVYVTPIYPYGSEEKHYVHILFDDGTHQRISPAFSNEEDANDYMLKAWGIILETLNKYILETLEEY